MKQFIQEMITTLKQLWCNHKDCRTDTWGSYSERYCRDCGLKMTEYSLEYGSDYRPLIKDRDAEDSKNHWAAMSKIPYQPEESPSDEATPQVKIFDPQEESPRPH